MPEITMPHSCEVTAARLDETIALHRDQISDEERDAMEDVIAVLQRIAREDREAAAR